MRKLFELPDETIGIISSLVVNHFLRRCWRYGLSAYHTLDKTTLLLSHPLRPRGHQRFQCPFLPALIMSITTYYRHVTLSDNILCLASLYAVERPQWTHSTSDKTLYVNQTGVIRKRGDLGTWGGERLGNAGYVHGDTSRLHVGLYGYDGIPVERTGCIRAGRRP